jgi:hypothetical protein
MRYIRSTVNLRIHYGPKTDSPNLELVIFMDADWAGQKSGCKSISGVVAMLYRGPVHWLSKVQRSVAISSTKSEYIAQSINVKTTQWLA